METQAVTPSTTVPPTNRGSFNETGKLVQTCLKFFLVAFPILAAAAGWGLKNISGHETRLTVVERNHDRIEHAVGKISHLDVVEERITQQNRSTQSAILLLNKTLDEVRSELKALRLQRVTQ